MCTKKQALLAVGFGASPASALPAVGAHAPFTERVISTTADLALSVFATDLGGDGDTDVLSASLFDRKIARYESHRGATTMGELGGPDDVTLSRAGSRLRSTLQRRVLRRREIAAKTIRRVPRWRSHFES